MNLKKSKLVKKIKLGTVVKVIKGRDCSPPGYIGYIGYITDIIEWKDKFKYRISYSGKRCSILFDSCELIVVDDVIEISKQKLNNKLVENSWRNR